LYHHTTFDLIFKDDHDHHPHNHDDPMPGVHDDDFHDYS
jgi:hypothetical protein